MGNVRQDVRLALSRTMVLVLGAILVIDADTVERDDVRWRLLGLDAPEIQTAKCPQERQRGIVAAARLIALIGERGGELVAQGTRRRDKWGRRLGRLMLGGEDWAAIAIREGHAHPWKEGGPRVDWCKA